GVIAGCMVTDGKVVRSGHVRVKRAGSAVYEGKIESLKRFKDDVKEVTQGFECGISIEKYTDFQVGDVLEIYTMERVER
ncbi:MAG: translation initiation factor IF-2, partial [Paenibacillaceae bacterium]|nr:translation initiation factor IF-2 [Paenibacillaceae bacterium]